jgi:16S rRNA (cytosine1402-N4)-methyltransferase
MKDKSKIEDYDYHNPVLRDLTIEYLINDTGGIYIDGTLGGGGHAAEILRRLEFRGKLIAFDMDVNAIEHCHTIFQKEEDAQRLEIYNYCFMKARLIAEQKYGKINGLLLDLGVSSMQLDSTAIGLSYRVDSDLDMRFGSEGKTAKELLNESDEDELLFILRTYGEEPNAKAIARRIIERRRLDAMETTFDLRSAVEEVTPEKFRTKALSRVFQAVRIAVNDELDVLQKTLVDIIPILVPGGRIVVMSYHSLEDRIVKEVFKEYSSKENPQLKILTKKPIIADEEEIKRNPRSRSVKIRVAEKNG